VPPTVPASTKPLVIFDCDGVLVDSEVLVSEAEAELLAAVGVVLTPAQIIEQFVGLSEAEMTRRVHLAWGVLLDDEFQAVKNERVALLLSTRLQPVEGIASVVASLDVPVCVASSSSPERIRLSLATTGLASFFGANVYSAHMVQHGKPAPDLFLLAASSMRTRPAQCVVVEDSPFGVAGGVAAGMTVLGFTGGSHCVPETAGRLLAAGASAVAASSQELAPLLRQALERPPRPVAR
jgi:HAD superfamily hydrolase (TIGR01509 family)